MLEFLPCIYRRSSLGTTSKQAVMMAPQFTRHLQTALQDTIGGSKWESKEFGKVNETLPSSGINIVGYVTSNEQETSAGTGTSLFS